MDKIKSICSTYGLNEQAALSFIALSESRFPEADVARIAHALDRVVAFNHTTQRAQPDDFFAMGQIIVELMNLDASSLIAAWCYSVTRTDTMPSGFDFLSRSEISFIAGLHRLYNIRDLGKQKPQVPVSENVKDVKAANKHEAVQKENHIKLLLTLTSDIRIVIIRLAFRLHAMRSLSERTNDEQLRIATETATVYAPIAHRLGMYRVKTEMEELALKHSSEETYRAIAKKLNARKTDREAYITEFIAPIKAKLAQNGYTCEVKGRPKSIHSIWTKMKKQGVEFEEVYDLFAIRVILDDPYKTPSEEKDHCWRVYSLLTDVYETNPKRLRDWVSNPKKTGYESLHTTVLAKDRKWVEVQIRTRRMDDIAEKGNAAHWKYKSGTSGAQDKGLDSWLAKIREDLEQSDTRETIDPEKRALYSDDIFIFTPTRELKKIRNGGSVLDFAYAIHTRVGENCTGAKVNGDFQPITYILQNGDVVEIITSKHQRPHAGWLDYVKSPRAISKIKKYILDQKYTNLNRGKEIIQRKCEQSKITFSDEVLRKLQTHYAKYQTFQELYEAVGAEEIDISGLRDIMLSTPKPTTETEIVEVPDDISDIEFLKRMKRKKKRNDYMVIDSMKDIEYELAKCCNPVRGDAIFGFISIHKGTKIHKTSCPNANDLVKRYPYRVVQTMWADGEVDDKFLASIFVQSSRADNLLNDAYKLLAIEMKLNLKSIDVDSRKRGEMFTCRIGVYVNDTKHLEMVLQKLTNLRNVVKVYRA